VHADDLVGSGRDDTSDLGDRDRAGVGGQNSVFRSHVGKVLEDFLFEIEVFTHSLDNKIGVLEDRGFGSESNTRHHEVNIVLVHSFFGKFLLTPVVYKCLTPFKRTSARVNEIHIKARYSASNDTDSSAHLSSTDNGQILDLV